MTVQFRIHPSIGFARVGNSPEYLIEPQSMAGMPAQDGDEQTGGLPVVPDTESDTVVSSQLRDSQQRLKRQASRFTLYCYPQQDIENYPIGVEATEVRIGSRIDGKTVTDILWSVHLANKKANWFHVPTSKGIEAYLHGNTPAIRNEAFGTSVNDPQRLLQLMIDAGPRAISSHSKSVVAFDRHTPASVIEDCTIRHLEAYPVSFPSDHHEVFFPQGELDCLGELQTDTHGRLIATGGYGRTAALVHNSQPAPLHSDTNNDGWFDDSSDGPVNATVVFDDGSYACAVNGAWLVVSDPGFAPQVTNSVTLWDDIYDVWVRHMSLCPNLFKPQGSVDGQPGFQADFYPSFAEHVHPVLQSAALHQWATNLNKRAIVSHRLSAKITPGTNPRNSVLGGLSSIRDPNSKNSVLNNRMMPLSMGDDGHDFLSLRQTQYFFLKQWNHGKLADNAESHRGKNAPALNRGEQLDKTTLFNCQGGRLSPGIDLSICSRDPAIWHTDWQHSGGGPFRIKHKPLLYHAVQSPEVPFLTGGYVPDLANDPEDNKTPIDTKSDHAGLEPGDLSKFMALPWHTDYNSCATHPVDGTLYWSWPAQRPVAVYVADDVKDPTQLPPQRWSIRGQGANSTVPDEQGRFAPMEPIVRHWQDIGVVIQATAIDDQKSYDPHTYLEVASLLDGDSTPVRPWPNASGEQPE